MGGDPGFGITAAGRGFGMRRRRGSVACRRRSVRCRLAKEPDGLGTISSFTSNGHGSLPVYLGA